MRNLRFRAWDSYQKKMMSWDEIGEADSKNYLSLWNVLIGACENIVPMQFTGLLDRNGKEIFEGDIVKINHTQNPIIGVVAHGDYNGGYFLKGVDPRYSYHLSSEEIREIIGNIHEHPHLLEKP